METVESITLGVSKKDCLVEYDCIRLLKTIMEQRCEENGMRIKLIGQHLSELDEIHSSVLKRLVAARLTTHGGLSDTQITELALQVNAVEEKIIGWTRIRETEMKSEEEGLHAIGVINEYMKNFTEKYIINGGAVEYHGLK